MYERTRLLFGDKVFNDFKNVKVLLIGIGGVGSYALETLVRHGFLNIMVVDYDKIDKTNLNRQIITDSTNIGASKVIEAIKRSKQINPEVNIEGQEIKLDKENIKMLINLHFDYIIDACDTLEVKYSLIENSIKNDYKLISCMGTANKTDPSKLAITTLDKTYNDPIAKILRKKVKDNHINKKINVISSTELPIKTGILASSNMVPSVAGILCVTYIIKDLIKRHIYELRPIE